MQKENDENLKQSAITLKERLEKEVPIMQQNLEALKRSENNFSVLPTTVHNVAVIHNEEVYRLIDLIHMLWVTSKPKERPWWKLSKSDFEKHQKKALEVLKYLQLQERKAYQLQLENIKKERARIKRLNRRHKAAAEKKGELEKFEPTPVPVIKDEIQYFSHVEYDPSRLLIIWWRFVTKGEHIMDENEIDILGKIRQTCIDIYEKYIPQRIAAIENCDKIIASYENEKTSDSGSAETIPDNA